MPAMLRRVLLLRCFHPSTATATASASSPPPRLHQPLPRPPPRPPPSRSPPGRTLPLLAAAGAVYLTADDLEETLRRSRDSVGRVVERMQHTLAAARVLSKSLQSVLSSSNQEWLSGFEMRVDALLADITAARRAAMVSAGGGAVVDWLLDGVVRGATQAEAARALAHQVSDPGSRPPFSGVVMPFPASSSSSSRTSPRAARRKIARVAKRKTQVFTLKIGTCTHNVKLTMVPGQGLDGSLQSLVSNWA